MKKDLKKIKEIYKMNVDLENIKNYRDYKNYFRFGKNPSKSNKKHLLDVKTFVFDNIEI